MIDARYGEFWGKARSRPDAPGHPWHPLAYHALDVAAVAEALLARDLCRPPPPWHTQDAVRSMVALLALHDIGKFSRPFQSKAPEHWPARLGPMDELSDPGHGTTGLALLCGPLEPSLNALFAGWERSDRLRLLVSVCGHHGRPVEGKGPVSRKVACPVCLDAARAFVDDVLALLDPPPLPPPTGDLDSAVTWWLAGVAVLADWIGSAETWFKYTAPRRTLSDYWRRARSRAQQALAASGVLAAAIRPDMTLSDLLGRAAPQRPVQASPVQALAASLDLGKGPVLALIEDQTGSGKTEAALLLAHRLMTAGQADGLFVALPTMATANAMYDRLAAAYRRLFAEDAQPSLVLAHGKRALHDGFQDSILADIATDDAADAVAETGSAQCAAWIADDRRRAFLAHVGVGTIDQALLAVLPSRHAALRLLGLRRRVLLIDEAHAYDPYMHEELLQLVRFQAGLGGSVVVLSATLPMKTRRQIAEAFAAGQGDTLRETHYPLVTVVRGGSAAEHPCEARPELARRVVVERLAEPAAAVARIAAASAAGLAVAWVRNSVADAAEAQARLAEAGVAATLFHARFSAGDRARIERQVMQRYGRQSVDRAGVVVATQVIEQSLDLDFDLLVSDLAPLDLLIQRAGRVWRHDRSGRSGTGPRLLVLSPEPVVDPPAGWLGTALRRTGIVYGNHALLWRSARILFAAGGIEAPGDVRRLVEAAYDASEVPAGLSGATMRAEGLGQSMKSLAWQNLLCWREGYVTGSGAWAADERTPTRLGEEATRFRLARWDGAMLRPWNDDPDLRRAWALSELSLPPWVATGVPTADAALAAAEAPVRAGWGRWERDLPVLALVAVGADWVGAVTLQERRVAVRYGAETGLSAV